MQMLTKHFSWLNVVHKLEMSIPWPYLSHTNEMKGFYAKVTTVKAKVNVKFPNVRKHNRICITIALLITLATPLRSHVRSDVSHTLNQMRNVKIYAKQRKLIKKLPQESLTICIQGCVGKEMFQISWQKGAVRLTKVA